MAAATDQDGGGAPSHGALTLQQAAHATVAPPPPTTLPAPPPPPSLPVPTMRPTTQPSLPTKPSSDSTTASHSSVAGAAPDHHDDEAQATHQRPIPSDKEEKQQQPPSSDAAHHDAAAAAQEEGLALAATPRASRWQRARSEMKRRVLHFTVSWFSINMGTGIVSILLHLLPYQFRGLGVISNVVFGLNVLLFLLFSTMLVLRFRLRNMLALALLHPQQSLFFGTLPMGLGTIVSMVALSLAPAWGVRWAYVAWSLWWIETALAVCVALLVPFLQFTRHEQSWETLTAAWLLPIVAPIVASASGATVAASLPDASLQRLTCVVAYVLWGLGALPALLVFALIWARLAIHKLPPAATIVTAFLPLGPCGLGGFALLKAAVVLRDAALATSQPPFGGARRGEGAGSPPSTDVVAIMAHALYVGTIPVTLAMWGLGIVWLTLAVASVLDMLVAHAPGLPFNIGFWGFTFPIGVFALSTIQLGTELDSGAFRVLGTILTVAVLLLWLMCLALTVRQGVSGELFFSPCLSEAGGKPPAKIDPKRSARKYPHQPRSASRGRGRDDDDACGGPARARSEERRGAHDARGRGRSRFARRRSRGGGDGDRGASAVECANAGEAAGARSLSRLPLPFFSSSSSSRASSQAQPTPPPPPPPAAPGRP